jgi:hypothetical protein
MLRVVLDANILVSALISPRGNPAEILARWEAQEFELVLAPPILAELQRALHYPRITARYKLPEEEVGQFLHLLSRQAIIVEPAARLAVIDKGPSDNRYPECALAGDASYIVSGDAHLLDLVSYREIAVLAPASFLALLKLENNGGDR